MDSSGWQLSEFLTLIGMIAASFVFIYQELQTLKKDLKEDFGDVRNNRKSELDQLKQEIMINLSDVKQTFKNDLNTFRIDLTTHRKELKDELILMREDHKKEIISLKDEAKKDMKDMQKEIGLLSERIARIDGTLAFLRDDFHPEKKSTP